MSTTTWRNEIITMLDTGRASEPWREIVRDFPDGRINERPPNVPYTFWQLLEHIRFCQWEVLDHIINPDHQPTSWPHDHWPNVDQTVTPEQWAETLGQFTADLEALKAMVRDESLDLTAPARQGDDETALGSILAVAEHNAHHWGEFAILRQVTGAWHPAHKEHDGNLA